ncbi:MBL fold metallo-hydrolase [Alphaproteobacteria bacterium KMM 3653]|uniref:MBL fold metallo-hydrolase n=2 Tax=Harenicola maris TaxID=2841044 RepID=A0AAP2CT22_9RHOB|nr:MBL fold metallo-hydrolase [Harenicola maris]
MRLPLPMALDHVNVFAFEDEGGWSIVDTGFDTRKARGIWQKLLDGPLSGAPIARVLVTHHHPDHIGLAGWFQAEHGAELLTTRTSWLTARMLTLDNQPEHVPEAIRFWDRAGMDSAEKARRMSERPFNFADMVAPLPLGYTRLQEGQRLAFGGRDWTVRMGNGHAPEHATLWAEEGDLVIAGDQMIASISPNIGVHATEPEADPLAEWLEACERLSGFARDEQLVLSGHKLPFTGLPARMTQLIKNHHTALERLMEHLALPRTAAQCFPVLFRRAIGPAEYGLALAEAVAHLNHLYQAGRISRALDDDGAWLWQAK